MFKEFKEFAFKGNVVDLAVGVVIGAAFGKIVAGVVADIIMPVVGLAMPSGDWRTAGITLREGGVPGPEGDARLLIGDLGGVVLDFLIVAFVLFLAVRAINRATKKAELPVVAPEPTTRECPYCFETIPKKATKCKACASAVTAVA